MVTPTVIILAHSFKHLTRERLRARLDLCQLRSESLRPAQVVHRAVRYVEASFPTEGALQQLGEAVDGILSDAKLEGRADVRRASVQLIFVASLDDVESLHRAHRWAKAAVPYLRTLPQFSPRGIQFDVMGWFLLTAPPERNKSSTEQQGMRASSDGTGNDSSEMIENDESLRSIGVEAKRRLSHSGVEDSQNGEVKKCSLVLGSKSKKRWQRSPC